MLSEVEAHYTTLFYFTPSAHTSSPYTSPIYFHADTRSGWNGYGAIGIKFKQRLYYIFRIIFPVW